MPDDNGKPKKDNASPKHDRKDVANNSDAPNGTRILGGQSLGLGTSHRHIYFEFEITNPELQNQPDPTPELSREEYLQSLPEGTEFTSLTGDADIDQQSIDNGDVPVTEEELEMLRTPSSPSEENDPDEISSSDFAKAFERAVGRAEELSQSPEKDKGPDLE